MTEALITDLGKIGALRVISRTSVMRFKGSDTPLAEIARQLNVEAVVEGSAQLVGQQAGITVRLIDAAAEKQLWSQTYQRDLSNLLVLQSELARAIAREIEVAVTPEETTRLASARSVNPEAHEAYLRGRFHHAELTSADLDAALSYFELSLEKDPSYAPAYAGIANVWASRNQMGYVPAREAAPIQKAAVLKALELDDSLAEAHGALAAFETWAEWDWPSAERAFGRAIELNPNYAEARAYYSHFLNIMGRPDEAMAQIERALELDPLNPFYEALYGADLLIVNRYDDAIAQLRKARRLVPGSPLVHTGLHTAFYLKGMYEEAFEENRAWFADAGDHEVEAALARGYAEAGYPGAMRLAADTLAARSNYNKPMEIAALYASAGKKDQALEWLENAFETRDPNIPYLGAIPHFDSLRDDPRYEELLRRMNLPLTRLQRK
jgi:tetratricopeptide (TPR) repeat protein